MVGDEKSEAIIGTWMIVAAGSELNEVLGGENGLILLAFYPAGLAFV
jgi:hypothetical protein